MRYFRSNAVELCLNEIALYLVYRDLGRAPDTELLDLGFQFALTQKFGYAGRFDEPVCALDFDDRAPNLDLYQLAEVHDGFLSQAALEVCAPVRGIGLAVLQRIAELNA